MSNGDFLYVIEEFVGLIWIVLLDEFVVGSVLALANTRLICNVVFVEKELICGLGISFGGDFCWG